MTVGDQEGVNVGQGGGKWWGGPWSWRGGVFGGGRGSVCQRRKGNGKG